MRTYVLIACALVGALMGLATLWVFQAGAGMTSPSIGTPTPPSPGDGGQQGVEGTTQVPYGARFIEGPSPEGPPEREWGPLAPPPAPGAERPGFEGKAYDTVEPLAAGAERRFVPDELLVRFASGTRSAQRQSVAASLGGERVASSKKPGWAKVELPAGSDVTAEARKFEQHSLVEEAQPNYLYAATIEPTDPAFTDFQHWFYSAVNAPGGWNIETGDPGVIVAVIDTGVDLTHPDLDDQIWVNAGETAGNGIDDDGNGCVDDVRGCNFVPSTPNGNPDDDFGHGTFVGGIVCAEQGNGVVGVGIAFDCTILPVKVLDRFGGGTSEDIANGITYAAVNGADVINMSLGSFCFPGEPPFSDPMMEAAIAAAHDTHGVTIVAAAGNNGRGCVSFPAADPNVIAVSASSFFDNLDGKAFFSQYGPEIDVTAPGVNNVSAAPPELCGLMGTCLGDGLSAIASGTSFATPQVAGLSALLLSQNPTRTNEDVRTIMKNTAYDLPDGAAPNWDGAGRIDVAKALGGASIFANVNVGHNFPPVLRVTVGAGDPSAPACDVTLVNFVQIVGFGVHGSFGVSECAASWPPSALTPWFQKGVDADFFPDNGSINDWNLRGNGVFCSSFDTPVTIPDDVPAGGVSVIDCPPVVDLAVQLTAPAIHLQSDPIEYEIGVTNLGSIKANPVVVNNQFPPAVKLAGPPPAGCIAPDNSVSCDLGSLGPGESATLTLMATANGSGLVTNCATVDPTNQFAEPDEDNNQACRDTEIISIPAPAFSNTDPPDDNFGSFSPSPPEITKIEGAFDASTFYLTVRFASPVGPIDFNSGQGVGGYIDFDTDQDPLTGFTSNADFYCFSSPNTPPGMSGSDVVADLFSVSGGVIDLYDTDFFSPVGSAPIIFSGKAFTLLLPISALSGDTSLDFTMVLGSLFEPTDCAPNGTVISCDAGVCAKGLPPDPPVNDDFANAKPIPEPLSPPFDDSQNSVLATTQSGEPQPCAGISNTVWYAFSPTRDTVVVADTAGSNFSTAIAAYRDIDGTLPGLKKIACEGSSFFFSLGHFSVQPQVSFVAEAGETYYLQFGGSFGDSGRLEVTVRGTAVPNCSPKVNFGFEVGIPDTNAIPCWTVVDQANGSGSWCIQTGDFAPAGDCGGGFWFVLSPPAGRQAAMTNQFGPGSHALYRCGMLVSDEVSFQFYMNNRAGAYLSPPSLDYRRFPNQQFRADLVSPAAIATDPFTMNPADILLNLYPAQFSTPAVTQGYPLITGDASAHVGQEVCLRFAEVDNTGNFHVGIDDVRFGLAKDPGGDTDGDTIPNGSDPDDDNDGCTDAQELGPNALLGGRRNPHNVWDFFDTPGGGNTRDQAITAGDVLREVTRFGSFGDPSFDPFSPPPTTGYHPAFDRSPPTPGDDPWDIGPPDGAIALNDILMLVNQFGHTCA